MIRDGCTAFIGSQSLRQNELDNRREVGVIFRDRAAVNRLSKIFQDDWAVAVPKNPEDGCPGETIESTARRVSKTVVKELPPVAPALESALEEIAGVKVNGSLDRRQVEATVRGTVKQAVASAVESVVREHIEEVQAPQR
jgi:cardiolipin synthase A/B